MCLGTAAIAARAAAAESQTPLADIRLDNGHPPIIESVQGALVVRGGASIEARVVAPADAFLCRLTPAANRDVVQMGIGRVESLRCNSLYSPSRDLAVTLEAGRVELRWQANHWQVTAQGPLTVRSEPDFMRIKRGISYYRPLSETVFSRAPAGWCSWYICGQCIDEEMITRNTDWLAAHLKKFGCEYVQIDDGWQGVGHGDGENRDWYVTDLHKFPRGMKWLADYIRGKGFKAGLWLIPFATSDEKLFRRHPDLFIRRADGTSAFEKPDAKTGKVQIDWTGRYAIDPTSRQARQWCRDLFRMICEEWGYDYVKIDGQGGSANVCSQFRDRLADPKVSPPDAYRLGLEAIKSVMGPKRCLVNCGGQPNSCGYCDGMRTGGDVCTHWSGVMTAMQATMGSLYLNNISFWSDPDVVCVRRPLTLEQARFWATMVGITGQLLMASDDMPALPEERVELLRRIFPVADIRPMDLYPLTLSGWPRIFDLRVSLPKAGQWDVVALFNKDPLKTVSIRLDPQDLGLAGGPCIFYDAWRKELLGAGSDGLTLALGPMSCRLLVVRRQAAGPQLVGTSRHLTQGADDLLEAAWDASSATWAGRSRVVGGDPYQLRFTLPPGWACSDPGVKVEGHLAVLTLKSDSNATLPWRIAFEKGAAAAAGPSVHDVSAKLDAANVTVSWRGEGAIAYRVYRNGELLTQTTAATVTDSIRHRGIYKYSVAAIGWQGETPQVPAGQFNVAGLPRAKAKDVWLDELTPVSATQDDGELQKNHSREGNPLTVGGKVYARGLGTHASSEILYQLGNRYRRLEAEVGVDDEKGGAGSVVFEVYGDGRKVFQSGIMRGHDPAKRVSVPLDDVDELRLVVTDAGDGIGSDHADWAAARLLGNR